MKKSIIFLLASVIIISCERRIPNTNNEKHVDMTNLNSIAENLIENIKSNDTAALKMLYVDNMNSLPSVYKKEMFDMLPLFKNKNIELLKVKILPSFADQPAGSKKMELYFKLDTLIYVVYSGINENSKGYYLKGSSIEKINKVQ